jgi:hypothetical protein
MKAHIYWRTQEQGGRRRPPEGARGWPPYATVVQFVDAPPSGPADPTWSLVVDKICGLGSEYEWLAEVRFLVAHAPACELRERRCFELYEGSKCVAVGVLLGDSTSVAASR